jgi:hypothetical protein
MSKLIILFHILNKNYNLRRISAKSLMIKDNYLSNSKLVNFVIVLKNSFQ